MSVAALMSAVVVVAAAAPADGAEERLEPAHRLTLLSGVFGELGPSKGSYSVGVAHRWTYGRDEDPIFDDLYVETMVEVYPNPFIPTARLQVAWTPIAPVKLVLAYTNYYYNDWENDFGHGLSMPTADTPFDADALADRRGEHQRQFVQRVEIKPVFMIQLERFIAYSEVELGLWYVEGPKDYWYDPLYDGLIQRGTLDVVLMNRTAVAVEAWRGRGDAQVVVGLVNQLVRGFGADTFRDRLGMVGIITPWDSLGFVDRPTLVIQPGITTAHRSRRFEFYLEAALYFYFDVWEG